MTSNLPLCGCAEGIAKVSWSFCASSRAFLHLRVKIMKTHPAYLTLITLFLACLCPTSKAVEPSVTKLLPANGETSFFGLAIAASEKFILIGDKDNSKGRFAGSVSVFNARTRLFLRKLTASDGAENALFGGAISLNGDLAVIGASRAGGRGAAYVFDVNTGMELRKFIAPDAAQEGRFGSAVAISGNLILVGAPVSNAAIQVGDPIEGAAYLFDFIAGTQVRRFSALELGISGGIGSAVALGGGLAVIAASGHARGGVSRSGSVVVVDARSGAVIRTLTPSGEIGASRFGNSLSMSGSVALIGAPFDNNSRGAAYAFDMPTGFQLRKLISPEPNAVGTFGSSVALSGNLALIGAPQEITQNGLTGAAHLMDFRAGTAIRRLLPSDVVNANTIGSSVALGINAAIIGSSQDDDRGTNAGAAYVFQPLAGPLGGDVVAQKGDFGIGAPDTAFSTFTKFHLGCGTLLQGTLTGAGSAGGRNIGVWNKISGTLDLMVRSADSLDSLSIAAISTTTANLGSNVVSTFAHTAVPARVTGTGVTTSNNILIINDNGSTVQTLVRKGDTLNLMVFQGNIGAQVLSGEGLGNIGQMAADLRSSDVAFSSTLVTKNGVTVTSANDSAILIGSLPQNRMKGILREGDGSFIADTTVGQINPRVAIAGSTVVASTALSGLASRNAGIIVTRDGFKKLLVRKGDTAPGSGGTFNTFLGETTGEDFSVPVIGAVQSGLVRTSSTLFRANLSGVVAALNEGLWTDRNNGVIELVAQKGVQVSVLDIGVKFLAFQRYWMLSRDVVVFQSTLTGTGVNASNDTAIFLSEGNGTLHLLMREGDGATGTGGAFIGAIQTVDVDTIGGGYTILVSLTGCDAGNNQALYVGNANMPLSASKEANRPFLRLRKGTIIEPAGSAITSIVLTTPLNATGAGGVGNGCTVFQEGVLPINPVTDVRVSAVLTLANGSVIATKL